MNPTLILWVFDFLTNRSQYVKVNGASSSSRNTNTVAPQGSVISSVLYTLCTSGKCHLPCTVHPVHLREVSSPLYCTPCTLQGSVISPVLYTLYTSGKCHLPCTVHPVHFREVLSPLYCTPCTPHGSVISPVLYTLYTSGKCYLPCTVHPVHLRKCYLPCTVHPEHLREVLSPLYCTPCTPQESVISPVLYTLYTSGKCHLPCTVHPVHVREVLSPLYCTPCKRMTAGQSNRTARTYLSNVMMIYVWLDSFRRQHNI